MYYESNVLEQGQKHSRMITIILFLSFLTLIWLYITNNNPEPMYCLIFGILFIYSIFSTQKLYIRINKIQKYWFIFIIYTIISSVVADAVLDADKIGSAKSSMLFLAIFFAILYISQFCDRFYFFKLVRNFLAICSVLGFIEYMTKFQFYKDLITVDAIERTYQIYGIPGTSNYRLILFFGHPIYFAIFLALFFIFLLYIPFNSKIINLFFELLSLTCLVLTQSRSSWISLIIILIIYFFHSKKVRKIGLNNVKQIGITVILVSIIFIVILYINPTLIKNLSKIIMGRLDTLIFSPDTASGARLANFSLLRYLSNFWIMLFGGGNGYALSLLQAHPTVNGWTSAIDNQYLTFFINYGVIGLFIFFYFVFLCIKVFKTTSDKINDMLILSVLSIFITGYFFEFYQNMYVNYFLFILIAFIRKDFFVDNK